MEKKDFMKLQNGSDIRGIACEGIEGEHTNLTNEIGYYVGQAFVQFLAKKKAIAADQCKIGVGTDSRITGPELKKYIMAGIQAAGATVIDCMMASTPAMFMSVVYEETQYTGSIMITASHLPFNRNGFKFFDADGGLEHDDITEILETAAAICEADTEAVGEKNPTADTFDLISLYSAKLVEIIRKEVAADNYEQPLKGLKIVVDAGNGAGGFYVSKVLIPLGADVEGSAFLDPDGTFPNHIPNPENKEAMAAICGATVANKADLGLIFDTDVDRMSAVLSDGTPINRDSIIAMIAAILQPENPGSTIITDSVTSDRLTDFLEGKLGLKHLCYMRGYKNVINKCKELNGKGINSPLAMETSGHGCLKENYYLDDGAFLAVKLVVAVAKAAAKGEKIDDLIADLSTVFVDREIRFQITEEDFKAYGKQVLADFEGKVKAAGYAMPESFEGIRVRFSGDITGWMLLRASLHDPVMVLNLEGQTEEDMAKITAIAKDFLAGYDKLIQNW